jgi:hypothetical protein
VSYLGWEIERRGSLWYAVWKTRTAIHRMAPRRTLRELRNAIDERIYSMSSEELFSA